MRHILTILTLLLLLATSCQKSVKELTDAIPADASYVVSINTKSLLHKSDDAQVKELLKKELESALETISLDQKKQLLLDEFMKDPTKIGLDFERNIYVYKSDKSDGLLAGIDDKDRIKNILLDLDLAKEGDIKEKESVYTFSPSPEILVAWDDSRLMILRSTDESESLSKLAIAQLHHTAELSMAADKSFQTLEAELKDVAILQKDVPFGQLKSTITSLTNISFDAGKVVSTSKIIYKDVNDNITAKMIGEIKGEHAKYIEDADFIVQTNLKGDQIYEYLEVLNQTKDAKMLVPNMQEALSNFDGDITFVVKPNTNEDEDEQPKFFLFAEIKDPSILTKLVDGLSNLVPIKKESPTSYTMYNFMGSFYLNINGKTMCLSNSAEMIAPSATTKSGSKNKFELAGKASFFQKQRDIEALNSLENFKMVVPNDNTVIITLDMVDKERNSFASILEIALKNQHLFSKYLF